MGYNNGVFSATRRLQPRYDGEKSKEYDKVRVALLCVYPGRSPSRKVVASRANRELAIASAKKHVAAEPALYAPEMDRSSVQKASECRAAQRAAAPRGGGDGGVQAIVVENGSGFIKAGFAGDDAPRTHRLYCAPRSLTCALGALQARCSRRSWGGRDTRA